MDKHEFQCRSWKLLYNVAIPVIKKMFNLRHDVFDMEGPCIVVCNHVTAWDPLLLSASFPKTKLYYVASEHLFRKGIISKIIIGLLDPIPRKKSTTATDTVKSCLRHLRDGHVVVLFPEGNASWNGLNCEIYSATGKLVRSGRVPLVTYRLEGGYLSAPRWGKGIRRGAINCRQVGVYGPEELRAMTPEQINALIMRDTAEDFYARQRKDRVKYKCKAPARYLERCLFLCPKCRKIGGLKGEGKRFGCSCGFETTLTAEGFFEPPAPFEDITAWDMWQHEALKNDDFAHGELLFSDEDLSLREIGTGHTQTELVRGRLSLTAKELRIGSHSFKLDEISSPTLIQAGKMPFSHGDKYYEIQANKPCCLRKYTAAWEYLHKAKAPAEL